MATKSTASIPQTSEDIDETPGSVGIGGKVRYGKRDSPEMKIPIEGKPITQARNMMARANFANTILSVGLHQGLVEIGSSYSLK